MDYNIKKDVPWFYLLEEDTVNFLEIFQFGEEEIHDEIANLKDVIRYDKADAKYIDLMLQEEGWPIALDDLLLKRKLLKLTSYIYSKKGVEEGIIFVIKQLMGIDIQIFSEEEGGFQLNNNQLGLDTILGFAGYKFHFNVLSPVLTPEEEALMYEIINFMRWAVSTFTIKQTL